MFEFNRIFNDRGEETPVTVFFGEGQEIKALYKSIDRAARSGNTELFPLYSLAMRRRFNAEMYGISIDWTDKTFKLISASTVLRLLAP